MITGKVIKDVAIGMVHVVALTEEGEVFTWGKKEYAQMSDVGVGDEPSFIPALSSGQVIGIAAGPTQVNLLCSFEEAGIITVL